MSKKTSVEHEPDSKQWEFDQEVAECFDDMLKRSIPQYKEMRNLVFKIGKKYVKHKTDIVDLGSSRGRAIEPFISKYGSYNTYHLVEKSRAMLNKLKEDFKHYSKVDVVRIRDLDLREEYPNVNASLTLSILTLQFIPIEYRQNIITNIYDNLIDNGAFILVEKVIGNTAELDNAFVDIYYDLKEKNGYSREKIEKKRKALEGNLVPVTPKWNEELLKMAGFRKVDCFWRWCNFAGWVAIK